MNNDLYLVKVVAHLLQTNETVSDKTSTGAFNLSNDFLSILVETVPNLRKSRDEQDVTKWFHNEN